MARPVSAALAAAAGGPQHQQTPLLTQPSATSCHHVCIHCGRRAAQGLYREYSRDNIRLTRCATCGAVADPLVEHELLLVLLDLVLHKREAYRHLLFNRPQHCALGWRGLLRVAAVLLVLDTHSRYAVYAHAAAAATAAAFAHSQNSSSSSSRPSHDHDIMTAAAAAAGAAGGIIDPDDTPAVQLRLLLRLFLLTLLEHAAFAGLVVGGALWLFRRRDGKGAEDGAMVSSRNNSNNTNDGGSSTLSPPATATAAAQPADPDASYTPAALARAILQALLYPAFGRLLVPFIMVWDPAVAVAGVVGALVLSSQWQALHAVATSAPFSSRAAAGASSTEGAGGAATAAAADSAKESPSASAAVVAVALSSSSVEPVVALPFLLGLLGRAVLRLLLAGRVVAFEGLGGVFSGKGGGGM